MLRVVVLGYGELAQSVLLGILRTRHNLTGIMRWQSQKPNKLIAFLRDTFIPDNLVSIIKANNLKEINAKNANSKKFIEQIKKLEPDVIIVGSWGEIFKKEVLSIPKVAFINCHPSLLPKHRGSNPYVSAIREGEIKTGITFHLVNEEIDAGDILLQEEVSISTEDTGKSLKTKCAFKAKEMVSILLDRLEKGHIIPEKQNESEASYYPLINDNDVIINWHEPAEFIHNQIRAFSPRLKCYSLYENDFLFIKSSKIVNLDKPVCTPGKIIKKTKKGITVSTKDAQKAIFVENIEVYGFLAGLWQKNYLQKKLKVGNSFKKI